METYKNLKKGTKVGLLITAVLTVLGLIGIIFDAVAMLPHSLDVPSPYAWIHVVLAVIMYLTVLTYALVGYVKPYGNTLKRAFVVFAICVLVQGIIPNAPMNATADIMLKIFAGLGAMVIIYISGRLNKIEKNRKLMVLAGLLIVAGKCIVVFGPHFDILKAIDTLSEPIVWAALCFAYVARFEEHKAAGLEDK